MLVQATDENKKTLKTALASVKGDSVANFTGALATAFEILHKVGCLILVGRHGCRVGSALVFAPDDLGPIS